ncbi:MAG: outer rane autotransporter, partial [Sphingomonas bacterium]|nr:outer rane autotransporter [Sphingomonas bacterium]
MPAPATKPQSITSRSRRPLMASCAIGAAMAALGHTAPVRAQSTAGTPSYLATGVANMIGGSPTASIGTGALPNTTIVTVNAANSIINWTPTDNATGTSAPIAFQQAGTATFQGELGSYTVLNRIVPTLNATTNTYRPISFAGTTTSGAGGKVWFYSPGGIILGAGSRFDVGSLVLTTNDILANADGSLLGPAGEIRFRGIADSRSAITVDQLATLSSAQASGSYVALVAPRIDQAGTIRTSTGAALIAAEAADLTINNGLFSIAVTSGSAVSPTTPGDDVTLRHSGSTGDQASAGGAPQGVYLVAVPKNAAVTMLVGGTLGYTAASSATTLPDGVVVLSAGANIDTFSFGSGVFVAASGVAAPGLDAS